MACRENACVCVLGGGGARVTSATVARGLGSVDFHVGG